LSAGISGISKVKRGDFGKCAGAVEKDVLESTCRPDCEIESAYKRQKQLTTGLFTPLLLLILPFCDNPHRRILRVGSEIEFGGAVGNPVGNLALYDVKKHQVHAYVHPVRVKKHGDLRRGRTGRSVVWNGRAGVPTKLNLAYRTARPLGEKTVERNRFVISTPPAFRKTGKNIRGPEVKLEIRMEYLSVLQCERMSFLGRRQVIVLDAIEHPEIVKNILRSCSRKKFFRGWARFVFDVGLKGIPAPGKEQDNHEG